MGFLWKCIQEKELKKEEMKPWLMEMLLFFIGFLKNLEWFQKPNMKETFMRLEA